MHSKELFAGLSSCPLDRRCPGRGVAPRITMKFVFYYFSSSVSLVRGGWKSWGGVGQKHKDSWSLFGWARLMLSFVGLGCALPRQRWLSCLPAWQLQLQTCSQPKTRSIPATETTSSSLDSFDRSTWNPWCLVVFHISVGVRVTCIVLHFFIG